MKRLLLILLTTTHVLIGQDAPAHMGDGSGVFPGVQIRTDWNVEPPKLMWHRRVGQGTTGFVISGKHVILGGNDGAQDIWWCIDSDSGSPLWQYAYKEAPNPQFIAPGPVASALIDAKRALIMSKTGMLHCLEMEEGKPLWKTNLLPSADEQPPAKGFTAAPLAIPQGILVAGGNHASSLICLSGVDGTIKWQSESLGGAIQTTPRIIERDGVIMAWVMLPQRVVGLHLTDEGAKETQSIDWESTGDPHGCPPLWVGNRLILPARRDAGFATFELKDNKLVPVYDSGAEGPGFLSAVVADEDLVGVINKGENSVLLRLDPSTGQSRWSVPLAGSRASCIMVGDRIIVLSSNGEMIVGKSGLSTFSQDAQIRVLKEPTRALLGFANERVYARNNTGTALCMSILARPAQTGTPAAEDTQKPELQTSGKVSNP